MKGRWQTEYRADLLPLPDRTDQVWIEITQIVVVLIDQWLKIEPSAF
jgi:hypothetical protein